MKRKISFMLLVVVAIALIRFFMSGNPQPTFFDLGLLDKALVVLATFGAFGFWFLMLSDFFKNQNMKYRTVWGFCLIFFSWAASLVYFFKYFLPRNS